MQILTEANKQITKRKNVTNKIIEKKRKELSEVEIEKLEVKVTEWNRERDIAEGIIL